MLKGDPLSNAWNGCLGPVLRNIFLTVATFLVAAIVAVTMDSVWLFLGIMFGGATVWWWLDRRVFAERFRREEQARKEFFGLDDQQ
jgi:Flp pilus assembly protein TadB